MEEEEKNQIQRECKPPETDLFLKWGNRKKLRCVRIKDPEISDQSNGGRFRRRVKSRIGTETFPLQPTRIARNSSENGKSPVENGRSGSVDENIGTVWPKLYITLSRKEKEEDFMAMKGCKPPHRPKKRAKIIQRSLLLVSPGAWLSDLCQERYEVREKKSTNKKRPRGLKALGSMDSGSE